MNLMTPFRRRPLLTTPSNLLDSWMRSMLADNMRLFGTTDEPLVPRADIVESDAEYTVTVELPGVEPAEVDVRVVGDQLVVSGERRQRKEEKDKHHVLVESSYGAFERRFDLPAEVRREGDGVKATFQKGLLEVKLPKVKAVTTKIAVKAT